MLHELLKGDGQPGWVDHLVGFENDRLVPVMGVRLVQFRFGWIGWVAAMVGALSLFVYLIQNMVQCESVRCLRKYDLTQGLFGNIPIKGR